MAGRVADPAARPAGEGDQLPPFMVARTDGQGEGKPDSLGDQPLQHEPAQIIHHAALELGLARDQVSSSLLRAQAQGKEVAACQQEELAQKHKEAEIVRKTQVIIYI